MKKVFLSCLLLVGTASLSHAQGVTLGLRAGANLARYAGEGKKIIEALNDSDMKMLVGFHGGITLNAPLTSDGFFSLQPELLYSQRGFRLDEAGDKLTVRHHYVDLPVLARINADGLIFEAGPQLGYLVASKSKSESNSMTDDNTDLDGYNRLNIGYVAGLGYQFTSGPSIGVRYNGGLNSIFENSNNDTKARHSVFQLTLGYAFGGR